MRFRTSSTSLDRAGSPFESSSQWGFINGDRRLRSKMRAVPPTLLSLWRFSTSALRSNGVPYVGWSGHGNAGDDAIFRVLSESLAPCDLTQLTNHDALVAKAFPRFQKGLVGLVLGGGTLVGHRPYREATERLLAASHGPALAIGTGVEDPAFFKPDSRLVEQELTRWANLFRGFTRVGIRGPHSAAILRNHGFNAEVIGDPALLISSSEARPPHEKLIGINVGLSWGSWAPDPGDVLDRVTAVCRGLKSHGYVLRLFSTWSKDNEYVDELARHVGVLDVISYNQSLDTFVQALGDCSVIVGQKLHSIVLGASQGVPSLALEYHPKCRDFQASIGREDHTVRIDQIDVDDVIARTLEMAADRAAQSTQMMLRVNHLRSRLMIHLELALQELVREESP